MEPKESYDAGNPLYVSVASRSYQFPIICFHYVHLYLRRITVIGLSARIKTRINVSNYLQLLGLWAYLEDGWSLLDISGNLASTSQPKKYTIDKYKSEI